jgi:two-component system chemotaxis sensor kinase CheA
MNPLLEQFLSESREFSQSIGEKLMQLEEAPANQETMAELFRLVHTLKGNSGLFSFPEMTRVLHAGEDLLGMVRDGRSGYSRELADRLLDAMDFVLVLCADIEATESIDPSRAQDAVRVANSLRQLMPDAAVAHTAGRDGASATPDPSRESTLSLDPVHRPPLSELTESARREARSLLDVGEPLHWIEYTPAPECFFQGDDPFLCARQTPGLVWGGASHGAIASPRRVRHLPLLASVSTVIVCAPSGAERVFPLRSRSGARDRNRARLAGFERAGTSRVTP